MRKKVAMTRFRGLVVGLFLCSLVALTPAAQAATASFRVLMDTDNSTATGCTVSGMDGVDQVLVTTVEIGATTAAVTATSLGHCGTPTLTPITTSGWPAAYHAPSGHLMVETRIPLSMFQMASDSDLPRNMRIGIEATKGDLTHTALTDSDGSIVLLPEPPHGRRRAVGPPGTPRSFTLDGVDTEWLPLDEKFDGIGAGGSFGLRILRAYAFVNTADNYIYFCYDANVSPDAPFADDDHPKRVPGHETLEIPAPGVLSNDEDNNTPPEPLTARPVSSPRHGTVIVNSDGSFTYTPENPSSRAADVFEYRANNGTKDSNTAKVKIKVGIGADDAFHGPQGLAVHVDAPGVLENDDAGNIEGLTATLLSAPSHGTVILNPNGGFTYTPDATFVGDDTFTYTVSGHGPSDTATVVITLDPKEQGQDNLPPHVLKDKFKVDENSPAGTLVGKVKVTDPNSGDTHTFTILSGNIGNAFAINASTGQITVAAPPSINFETRAHYDLVVRAADNGTPSLSDAETIEIDVQNKNDAPVGVTQTVTTAEEVPLAITLSATDEDGNSLTYSIGVNPAHGVLSGSAPNVTYTPNQNYVGADSFTFTASDGTATSTPVTIHINVTAINDEPLFTAGPNVTVNEDSGAYNAAWATGVAPGPANATDEAGQIVSFNVSNDNTGLFLVQPAIDGSGNLTFTPALNATGFATVTATIVDNGSNTPPNDNTGATVNFTITLIPVNDPPSFVKGPDQSANEDGGLQTALGWATLISPGPADEAGQAVAFNIVTNSNPGLFASGPSITPTGDLTYTPAPNASGVATITITLSDNGGGTNTSAPQSFTITINGVNDAPVNTVPAAVQVTAEETPIVFNAGNGNAIQTSDIDVAAGTMQFQLSVTSGTLTLATTTGLTITTGTDGIDEASIIGTGTLTNINAALNGLSYTPNVDYFGSDTLTLVINDNGNTGSGGAQSDTDTVTISITAVDDSPTLTAGGGSPAFVEDAGPVAVDPAITPADVDNANLVSATVTITNLLDAGVETLAASTGGTSITAVYAAPTLTLTGSDTLANYQTVLRSITYENTSGAPTTTARSITFVVNDGNSNSNTVTKTLSVTPANDAPVLTAGGGSPTFTEDGAAAVVDNGLAISDVDNTTLASATVTITNLLNAGSETLAVNVGATGLIASYSAPTLTLTGTATLAQYETVLRTVTYSNSSNTPNTTARVISFQVNDGAANSNTVTTSVSVVANDDAPVLTAGGGSPAFTEDGGAVAVDPAITPSDVDSANLASATVTITNLLDAGMETLAASTGGTSITAVYAAPTLTLTGSDTLANYQTVLRSITYNNASQNPSTTARSISFVVNDGTSNSNTASKSVTVTPVNDAPVLVAGGGSPTFTEDGAPAVVDNGLTISDVDNTTLASATVTITNLLNAGAETLAVNVGATGLIANYSAPTLTLTGVATLAQYETVLRTVTYSNSSNTPNTTARVISFQVNDGAANSNTVTKSVSVVATDDAPTLVAGGASPAFTEDGAAVAVDPAITPSDVDSANLSSATVTITNLLDAGAETLAASTGGTSITAVYAAPTLTLTGSDTLANYQAVLRSITYNNTSQNPNTTARSISFVVNDGTSNSNTVTKTLSITPSNDAPVLTSGAGVPVFTEDGAPAVVDGGLTISDVDSANLATATVTITNLLNAGSETLAVNVGATGLIASYVAPTLTLTGSATLAQYETVLRTVTYSNSSNTPNTTARVISFVVNDGAANSNTASKSVAVVATNDAPVLTAGGGSPAFTEGAGAVAVDPAITPSDVDSASLSSATVTITNLLDAGLETLAASTGGTSITAVYAAPTLTLTGVDTLANYQTVLRSVTYNNSSNAPNTTGRSISFVVNDGAANSNTVTKTVSITTVNSAPTLVAGGGAPTFVEDAGPVVVDNGITPADVDSTTLASATITITNPIDGAAELLAATTGATSIVASYVAPTLTLTGVDTIANYQTVLRTVTYENTSDTPNTTARVISFKVNDGSLDSNVTTKNVAVVPANDAPVVTTTVGNTSFTEAAGAVIVDAGVTPTDVDSASLASATVTITNLLDAGLETLAASTGGTSITAVYAAPVLTLTGVDTKANYQTVLRSVTYNNSSNAPNPANRVIAFQVNDGTLNSNIANKTVTVTSVNSAPTVTTSGGTTAFVEDAGSVIVDGLVTPADVDSTTLASAQVTITNLLDAGLETLSATTGATAIVASYSAPTLTLTGVDSIANYQTVLRTVRYNNTSNTPNTTVRSISFKVNDGTIDSNIPTKSVSVTPANDAPSLATSGGSTPFTEDGGTPFIDTGVTITDPDSPTMASATVTISNLLNAGAEFLSANTTGTSITASYVAPVLTLTGVDTIANYHLVLRKVLYNNTSQNPNTTDRTISFQVNDGAAFSNIPTRTVNITAVNDAPTVTTSVGTSAFVEDAGPIVVDNAVTPADIDNTTLASATVTITNLVDVGFETLAATTGGTLITANYAAPTLTLTGVDTIANYQTVLRSITYNNSSNAPTTTTRTIDFKVNDGALDSSIASKSVSVTATNDAPVLTASGTLAYTENQAATALGVTIGITDPDSANMSSATVTITGNPQVAADVLAMATQNGISATYVAPTLTLTGSSTIANYITALQSVTYQNTSDDPSTLARTITYQVNDGTANSNTATSTVNITATNDAPVNNPPTNPQSVNEDTALNFTGAGNTVSVTDPDAQSGSNFSVQVVTTNGTTTIVTPVGVTFTPVGGNGTASYTITGTLANINASLATLRFNPTLNFPNALASGTASVQLITNDGGNTPAPAQGDNDTFNITVNQVNDPPTAGNDAWDTIGNTELRVDLAAGVTPNVPDTTTNSNGVASNDSDLAVENNPFTVTSIVGCADLVTPYDCTLASGSIVSMNAAGTFTFKPSPTIATGTPTDDTFQYVITDQPVAGTPQTATGTVTIHVFDKVWYVKQGGTGNGRSDSPLGSFTGINNAGGAGDSDSPTDYIFVHAGTSITTSIELEANQHLLGEGVGISINRNLNGNGAPANLVAAGVKPIITSAVNTVAITAAMAAEVRGLNLSSSAGNPIDVTSAGAYTGSPSLTISDNLFTTASAEDIDVNAGATGTLALTIQNNDWVVVGPHSSQGIDVRTTAGTLNLNVNTNTNVNVAGTGILIDGSGGGTVNITGFNDNFVHQNTVGSGITVTSATFDTTPGVPFQTVAGGVTRVGTVGNGVGGAGMVLTNVAGDLSFTDLDITNDNGSGLAATGLATYTGSAGFQIAVPAGVATITTVGGPAVNLNTVTASLPLSTISSLNSATTGVNLATVIGTVTAPVGSSITNATGTDFNITGGTATVTYSGTITDDVGQLVNVSGATGGVKQFLGAITDNDDTDGSGISLTTNTGATIRFSGGLVLSTGGNAAFTATGGGTVEICAFNPCGSASAVTNKLTTSTGMTLNVANTTIGANDLTFRSIAANGASSGIVLNNTGATGSLIVTGAGTASVGGDASGGIIQNTTGDGVMLTNTAGPSFTNMTIQTTGNSGIKGQQVSDFTFKNGTITGSGGAVFESNLSFNEGRASGSTTVQASGTFTVTDNVLNTAFDCGIEVSQLRGTISQATITGNTLTSTTATATSKGSGIQFNINGDAGGAASLTKALIDNNVVANFPSGAGIKVIGGQGSAGGTNVMLGDPASGTNVITITNNNVHGQSAAVHLGTNAIETAVSPKGQGNFNISNNGTAGNPLTNVAGTGIALSCFGNSTVKGVINNNVIVANNTVNSSGMAVGADTGFGFTDTPDLTATISNNTISGVQGNGILAGHKSTNGTVRLTITGNNVAAPTAGARPGIRVDSGTNLGGDTNVCLDIQNNTSAGSGSFPGIGVRKEGNVAGTNDFGLEGLAPSPANPNQTEDSIAADNPGSALGAVGFSNDGLRAVRAIVLSGSNFVNCNSAP
jgi:hypothetical protein